MQYKSALQGLGVSRKVSGEGMDGKARARYNADKMKHVTQLAVAAIVETGLLCLLSYLLFLAGQRLVFNRRSQGGQLLWHLIRLPGNLVHELSHAVVLTIVGFKVTGLRVSLLDREEGRGAVYVQGRWHNVVRADLGWALGAMAPVVGGVGALVVIAQLLHLPAGAGAIQAGSLGEAIVQRAVGWLGALNFREPATYGLLLLIFSVAAELTPSEQDLRSSLKVLVAVACLAAIVGAIIYALPPTAPMRVTFDRHATAFLHRVMAAQEMALSVVCGVALLLAVPVALVETWRLESEPASVIHAARSKGKRDRRLSRTRARRRTLAAKRVAGGRGPHSSSAR